MGLRPFPCRGVEKDTSAGWCCYSLAMAAMEAGYNPGYMERSASHTTADELPQGYTSAVEQAPLTSMEGNFLLRSLR